MKIFRTLPTDESFYHRYVQLIPTLYRLGIIAQIVSALTEFGIIWALVYSAAEDFSPAWAPTIATVGAIIGTALLELGLRKFTPYSIRAIIHRRFSGPDLAMSVIILVAALGLLGASGFLSFRGSKGVVAAVAPPAEQRSEEPARELYNEATTEAKETYRTAKADIRSRYSAQAEALQQQYAGKVGVEEARLDRYKAREKATGNSYRTAIGRINSHIAEIKAEQAEELAALRKAEAEELAAAQATQQQHTAEAREELAAQRAAVTTFNQQAEAERRENVARYGGGLAWFTVFCLLIFVLSVTLHELHHKGAGIEEKALPSQYDFSQGVAGEFFNALQSRIQYKARTLIQRIEAGTPPAPAPTPPPGLYDLAALEQPRYSMKFEQTDPEEREIVIPAGAAPAIPRQTGAPAATGGKQSGELEEMALEYTRAYLELMKAQLEQQAKEMELKAEDVIRAYLGNEATPESVGVLKQAIIDYLNGNGPNPFEHHHRKNIGFTLGGNGAKKQPPNDDRNGDRREAGKRLRNCQNCGQEFSYKHWNKRYCSDECRIENWENRTGKKLNRRK